MVIGFVPVPGGQLYYEEGGRGLPVVLLHAGFLDSRMWSPQFRRLATEFQVVRYDRRGYGRSPLGDVPFSEVEDLRRLVAHLGIDSPVLVGCSDGGRTAIDFALAHPRLVRALALIAPAVTGYAPASAEETRWWEEFEATETPPAGASESSRLDHVVGTDMAHWCAAQSPESWTELERIARDNADRSSRPSPLSLPPPDSEAFDHLANLRLPTLVLVGGRDMLGVQTAVPRIAGRLDGARLVRVPTADHIVNRSAPVEFESAVVPFLRGLTTTSAVATGVGGGSPAGGPPDGPRRSTG